MVRKQVIENYIKQLQKEKEILKSNNKTLNIQKEQAYKIADDYYKENQELKKQREDINNFITKCGFVNVEQLVLTYIGLQEQLEEWKELLNKFKIQQKEFIKYLKNMIDDENDIFSVVRVKDVLQKYKEIIGVKDENTKN